METETPLPTASNPAPISVECPEDIPAPNTNVVTNANDNCGNVIINWTGDQVINAPCPSVIRTYSISDICGNIITVTQTINVVDDIAPSASVQDTLFIPNGGIPPPNTSVVINILDNCSAFPQVAFFSENSIGTCPIFIDRVYSITDNCGNVSYVTHTLVIGDLINPVNASFSFNPPTLNSLNSSVQFINSSANAINYQWDFGDNTSSTEFQPIHQYDPVNCLGFLITLVASDGICYDTVTQVIQCKEETIFYVPNAFTPDGDNYNQVFSPIFYSGFDPFNFEMLIYNRWGELIFETHNVEIGWDGTYGTKGRMTQDDVYTWKISYKIRENDNKSVVMGHVTLIR